MKKRDFLYSYIPGLEQDVSAAKDALNRVYEAEFKNWAEQFPIFPQDMLRELWEVEKKKRCQKTIT